MDFSVAAPRPRVHLHRPGCEKKVHKELQKLKGVKTIAIDREHGKVTVSGAIDPHTLQKALSKIGKRAEILWDSNASMNLHPTNQNHGMLVSTSSGTHLDPEQVDQFSRIEGLNQVELTHKRTIRMTFNGDSHHRKFVADHEGAHHHGGGGIRGNGGFDNRNEMSSRNDYYVYGGGGGGSGHVAGCGCTQPAARPAGDGGGHWAVGGGARPAPSPRRPPPLPIAYSRSSVFCDENPNSCMIV